MEKIILNTTILKPVLEVWEYYTQPEHIKKWNITNENWVCPRAENDLRTGGRFNYRMETKDGSYGFDYAGTFDEVIPQQKLSYTLDDGRKAEVIFNKVDETTTEVFLDIEAETKNPVEMQKNGLDKILHSFELYSENQNSK